MVQKRPALSAQIQDPANDEIESGQRFKTTSTQGAESPPSPRLTLGSTTQNLKWQLAALRGI